MSDEIWKTIREFPNYEVSDHGNIYNARQDCMMRTSRTRFGHTKITLASEWDGQRYTRSVAHLVAEAFVEPPNAWCDHVVILDGNFDNLAAHNLAWRPAWFTWKYTHQLRTKQPDHYHNFPVINITTGAEYDSIMEAGIVEGLLFDDIWKSTYALDPVFPYGVLFEIS